MPAIAQLGIAIGALGVMLSLMGLFPSVTGIEPGAGVGIVQVMAILIGFTLLTLGALIYVKFTFYIGRAANFSQQIGVRLSLTGLVLAAMSGLADFLGFGSHTPGVVEPVLGVWQAVAILMGFFIASLGVIVYALRGTPPDESPPDQSAWIDDQQL
ncbi:MAG: hypothetical protein SGI73_18010 [Chloroflexota bacterium]|nr:hypothetical protein [Chloroflexota bacterium]